MNTLLLLVVDSEVKRECFMLNKSISYKVLLRIVGIVLIAFSLFWALSVAFPMFGAGDNLSGTLLWILWTRSPYGVSFPIGGVLTYVGLGLLFITLSSMRVKFAYWSLQLGVWLIGINVWFQQNNELDARLIPPLVTPFSFWPQMVVTLFCSLLLFALYVPLTRLLRRLFEATDAKTHVQAVPTR